MDVIKSILPCIVAFLGMPIYAQTISEAEKFVGVYEISEVCAIAPAGTSEFDEEDIFETDGRFLLSIEAELNEGNNLKLSIIEILKACSLPKDLRAKSSGNMQFQINETLVIDSFLSEYITGTGVLKNENTLELEYRLLSSISCDAAICRSKGQKINTSTSSETMHPKPEANIYFDPHRNSIIFESSIHTSFLFELYDLSGRCILQKINTDGASIPIPDLPNGIYPYRIQKNGRILQTGKIMK